MPMKLQNPNATFGYVPKEFREDYKAAVAAWKEDQTQAKPEEPPVFILRAVTGLMLARLRDESMSISVDDDSKKSVDIKVASLAYNKVRFGVVGWERIFKDDGTPLTIDKAKDGGLSEDVMKWIDPFIDELAAAITERNSLTVEDLGK